ncbi:hypothetical protein FHS29_003457 [Saccharothrix tamanrassetensis]|uniref:Uncharacterized protein n=1 Tax=Saccharothrix tamanrassetensis TaxID=1051531 RepID=A0A841CKH4_9PSEU|nr:hypothetical protein [Saccharothrix tamanrassetensis]MBB5956864.1 hypothetical protein [Saccharothrix tamanrassetensis]
MTLRVRPGSGEAVAGTPLTGDGPSPPSAATGESTSFAGGRDLTPPPGATAVLRCRVPAVLHRPGLVSGLPALVVGLSQTQRSLPV